MYFHGDGVPEDYETAAKWLIKSSDKGDAVSQWGLGLMYIKGIGVEHNETKGFELIKKSADQGYDAASLCTAPRPLLSSGYR